MNSEGKKVMPAGHNRFDAFLAWWISELSEMAPRFLKRKSTHSEKKLLVLFSDDAVSFSWHDTIQWRKLLSTPLESARSEFENHLIPTIDEKHITIARLPAKSILHRSLNLPIAAENELRQILTYQLDSLSPYPPDQVYFSHQIKERDHAAKRLSVELYLSPREEVDRVLRKMHSWNLVPDIVDFVGQDELAEPVLNLLPSPLAQIKPRRVLSATNKVLLTTNVLLAAALFAINLMTKADLEQELTTRVETAKLKADATLRLRDKVEKLQAENSLMQEAQLQRLPVLAILEELSAIIPDDTWLERAVYGNNEIALTGISKKASVLVGEIEHSPLFENAAFQASVIQDDRSGGERFQLKADISGVEKSVE